MLGMRFFVESERIAHGILRTGLRKIGGLNPDEFVLGLFVFERPFVTREIVGWGAETRFRNNPGTKLKTKKVRSQKLCLKQGGGCNVAGHFRCR